VAHDRRCPPPILVEARESLRTACPACGRLVRGAEPPWETRVRETHQFPLRQEIGTSHAPCEMDPMLLKRKA
jgi:hypothetical protein